MLAADLALAIVAALAVALDRRVTTSLTTKRRIDRAVGALAVAVALAGVAIGLVAVHGHVLGRVEHAWNSFADANTGPSGSSRFTALGSQRVDFWRVALNEWDAHPLAGVGQDNFAANYLQHRRTGEEPRWAHSLELRLLVHTGLVGALLFVLFVTAVGIAALRGGGARGRPVRFAAAVALLPFVVWIVHGSIDWFWEFPALSVPALAFAGAATALGVDPAGASASTSRRLRVARLSIAALLGAGALAAVAIAYASAHEIQRATNIYTERPAQAYAELHSASNLMPFDAQIYLLEGSIALDYGEASAARGFFEQAARHDDEEWLAPFVLGLLAGERGARAEAIAQLRRALRLNPGEQIVSEALTRAGRKHPLTVEEAQRILSTRVQTRFGR
jgi:hypothetical protein